MANAISPELTTGTVGELLVQIRLLQYDVQAAPPLKDSGNDLIALRGFEVRCIQVKTTTNAIPPWPADTNRYHLLALVRLAGQGHELFLDRSEIFLLRKGDLTNIRRSWDNLERFALSRERIEELFQEGGAA